MEDCERGEAITRIIACDAIVADPASDAALRSMALVSRGYAVFSQAGDTAEPLANFTTAAQLDPGNAAAAIGMGTMHFSRKEYDQAESAYNTAIKLVPGDATPLSSLGKLHAVRGDKDKALANYDKAIAVNKRHPGANLNKADLLAEMDRKGEALALYRFCLYLFDRRVTQYGYIQNRIAQLEAELGQ
jgi:tetratricopeptide (TPR) repeat protein